MKNKRPFAGALLGGAAAAACLAPPALAAPAPASSAFHPLSATFVSLKLGWALGTVPCKSAGACLALVKTTDSGKTWADQTLPAALAAAADRTVTNGVPKGSPGFVRLPAVLYGARYGYGLGARFANPSDGWIYGSLPLSASSGQAVLWATHNGGASWRELPVSPAGAYSAVLDLEAAGGSAYMMVASPGVAPQVKVESSPVGSNSWRPDSTPPLPLPAGGTALQGAIVLRGGKGWLLEGNDRGVAGSAQLVGEGRWSTWAPPCASVGNSYVVPAASSGSDLVVACQMGGYAYPLTKSAPAGATLGSWWLYYSDDAGRSFAAGPRLGPGTYPFSGLIASPSPGVVFVGYGGNRPGQARLLGSFNAGRSWLTAYKGDFFYVGFTSSSQGFGLLRPSPANFALTEMVMTTDGGRHWSRVNF